MAFFITEKDIPLGKDNDGMDLRRKTEEFLSDFQQKMKTWGVLFRDDRGKNLQALANLEIRPKERRKILESLKAEDYYQGPIPDKLLGGSKMWVFGKHWREFEIYIKITMGASGTSVICISFHEAEFPMEYPLKA